MLRSKTATLLALVLALGLAAGTIASAEIVIYSGDEDLPLAERLPAETAGDIRVDDTLVMRIPGAGGGIPLAVRAAILDTRITEILSAGIVGPLVIGDIRGKPTIWVGPYRLVTVYPEDAAAMGTDMRTLAEQWAAGTQSMLYKCSPAVGPSTEETSKYSVVTPAPEPEA
ncbi:MAG: hypothetical protein GX100_00865 [candidate division WS1 bacterium]|nr:hypothetical protein [candidate division WS1 bacterium]